MNRQQAKDLLPIIQAFAEGKTIQYQYTLSSPLIVTDNPSWKDVLPGESVDFNNRSSKYRIKPEPKYRPFIDNKECWNEMLKHQPFGWVRTMNAENDYYIIDGVLYSENIDCPVVTMAGESYDYKEMLDIYLFADGTPFGIKI